MTRKNLTQEESLKEMKRLMEFHFKSHTRDSVVDKPNIVKFNDVAKPEENNVVDDYPSFDEYIDEVINEEDPEGSKKPVQPQQKQVEPKTATVAEKPAPQPVVEPKVVDNSKYDEVKVLLDKQNAKTDELLAKLNDMETKFNSVDVVNAKIEKLANDVKEAMPPSYEEQLDMISKKSFPYNVKLSDYWKFDKNQQVEPKEYTLDTNDIKDVNDNDIKNTFAVDLNKNALNKVR